MKQIAAYTFVLLYLLAMARPVIPLGEYIIYEDYIAEFLCVNKDKTELQCNGKCYLMQRLTEQNEEKKQNLPKILLEEYPIGFVDLASLSTQRQNPIYDQKYFRYHDHYTYLFTSYSFHPPSQMVIF